MTILQDLTSRDAHRIWSGACAVRNLRDRDELHLLASHISEIREATLDVSLGGALRPNSSHLDFAIHKLEFVKDPSACLCSLYTMDDLYDPAKEQESGNVKILGTTLLDGGWVDFYECECLECGAKYRVEEREYHYTWWAWKRA